MIAALPALVFWFQTAPQVRFGYGYIFPLAALPLTIVLNGITLPKYKPQMIYGFTFALLLFMRIDRRFFKITLLTWPKIPTAILDTHHLNDGSPISTPQGDDRVWNANLPTTTDIHPGLSCITNSKGQIREWQIQPAP